MYIICLFHECPDLYLGTWISECLDLYLGTWISAWAPGSLPGYLELQRFRLKMFPAKGKEHAS